MDGWMDKYETVIRNCSTSICHVSRNVRNQTPYSNLISKGKKADNWDRPCKSMSCQSLSVLG